MEAETREEAISQFHLLRTFIIGANIDEYCCVVEGPVAVAVQFECIVCVLLSCVMKM